MNLLLEKADPLPLTGEADGTVRVTGTRVTLDTLAEAFQDDPPRLVDN